MSRWFGFGSSGGVWLCVDTRLGGDFYRCLLGRCKDCLVLLPREMSSWLGLVPRETLGCVSTHFWVVPFTEVYSGDVKMVWFYLLGSRLNVCRHMSRRCLLQRFTREMSRLFGFGSSGDTWLCRHTIG